MSSYNVPMPEIRDQSAVKEGRCASCGGGLTIEADNYGADEDGLMGGNWGWCPVCRFYMRLRGDQLQVRIVTESPSDETGAGAQEED